MKTCPKCGAVCEDGIKFCAECGTSLEETPAVAAKAQKEATQDLYEDIELDEDDLYEMEYGEKKTVSVIAVIALICSIAGCLSSGYAMIIIFGNPIAGIVFFLPGILGILLGFVGFKTTGKGKPKKGRVISAIAFVLGVIAIIFWVVVVLVFRHMAVETYGSADMISILRTILTII